MGKVKESYTHKAGQQTSWQKVSRWYEKSVGDKGHYFHQTVVLPNVLRLLDLEPGMHLIDLGCGQGVLERQLPLGVKYTGVDVAADLVEYAKNHRKHERHEFLVADATKPIDLPEAAFERAALVLALQNMQDWVGVWDNLLRLVKPAGKVVIVLNHPYYRIPKQTAWGEDEQSKQQFRKVYRYMSETEIPITMDPGRGGGRVTWSYHRPLSALMMMASKAGFVMTNMEEWTSDKSSDGRKAKMENRARQEIPLFMGMVLEKRPEYLF